MFSLLVSALVLVQAGPCDTASRLSPPVTITLQGPFTVAVQAGLVSSNSGLRAVARPKTIIDKKRRRELLMLIHRPQNRILPCNYRPMETNCGSAPSYPTVQPSATQTIENKKPVAGLNATNLKRLLEVAMGILTFILFLFVAAACAYLAERLVPGTIPGGFFTSAIVGIIGAWIGGSMLGSIGPSLAGVSLIPCILGSALLVFLLSLCSRGFSRRHA